MVPAISSDSSEDSSRYLVYSARIACLKPARHPTFYFGDGNCIFLIESVLFNLHRFMLATHSPVFRTLFELPPPLSQPCDCGKKLRAEGEQEIPEGSDDHHPIVLNGIMVADMEPFLTILYMPVYECDERLSCSQWMSVLETATRYDFAAIRSHAISRLDRFPAEDLSPVSRLSLSLKYDLSQPSWLFRPLSVLVRRKEPLSINDVTMLGIEVTLLIFRAREEAREVIEDDDWCDCCERCGRTSMLEVDEVEDVVITVFGLTEVETGYVPCSDETP